MKQKTFFTTKNIVIIGMFAAICFVALYFKIPIPSPIGKPFLHFGNMVLILASLLFGGLSGALAGSIGMGLFDILNGYVDSSIKTIILKFGIGIIVGLVFSCYKKDNEKSPALWLYISAVFFLILGTITAFLSFKTGGILQIGAMEKPLVLPSVLYIFLFILGALLLVCATMSHKMPVILQFVLIASVAGIGFNLCGEFMLGALQKMLVGSGFIPAVIASSLSLPATLINGTFSILGATFLYIPLSKRINRHLN